jgi:hypothetical protein
MKIHAKTRKNLPPSAQKWDKGLTEVLEESFCRHALGPTPNAPITTDTATMAPLLPLLVFKFTLDRFGSSRYTVKKGFRCPVPSRDVTNQSDIPAGDGKNYNLFLQCSGGGGGGMGGPNSHGSNKKAWYSPFHCFMIESITDKAKCYFFVFRVTFSERTTTSELLPLVDKRTFNSSFNY